MIVRRPPLRPSVRQSLEDFRLWLDERRTAELFALLTDDKKGVGLPAQLPILARQRVRSTPPRDGRLLTVKVGPGCEWLLLLPLDHFARLGFGSLGLYSSIEWVTTDKTLMRCAGERARLGEELSDLAFLLAHTVVILNTYSHFEGRKVLEKATDRVVDLLRLLTDVEVQSGRRIETLSLRWLRNPSDDEVDRVLRDPGTWFVLADFHVDHGVWQLGGDGGPFDVGRFAEGALAHVRLMRVFHCHSIGVDSAPSSESSIVDRLLRAGAMRVEGSTLPEAYEVFLEELMRLLGGSSGLAAVLFGRCLARGVDLSAALGEIRSILASPLNGADAPAGERSCTAVTGC